MLIIKKGVVEEAAYRFRLIDEKGNVIARLFGDWAWRYKGKQLGIIALDEDERPTEVDPLGIEAKSEIELLAESVLA
jgi:hypothetical protein